MVPEGSVDVQVNLLDLSGEAPCLQLHFLENEGVGRKQIKKSTLCLFIFSAFHIQSKAIVFTVV